MSDETDTQQQLVLDLGFKVPTRVVALDRDRGHWENELQVDIGHGWERVMAFSPEQAKTSKEQAFIKAVELARKNGPRFFEPWLQRRSTEIANAQAKAAELALKEKQHADAAPKRQAYLNESFAELGRRADEKSAEANATAALAPSDPVLEREGLR